MGVRSVVLATGHLADRIEAHYAEHPAPLPLCIVKETELLGTGGGVANALPSTVGDRVLVLNGDSLLRWSLERLHLALDAVGPEGAAMGVVPVDDLSRYGGVDVSDGRITAFREKTPGAGAGLINAGVYLFGRSVLEALPRGVGLSLERQVFPGLATGRRLAAAEFAPPFIDIGLPETYAAAPLIVPALVETAAVPAAPSSLEVLTR